MNFIVALLLLALSLPVEVESIDRKGLQGEDHCNHHSPCATGHFCTFDLDGEEVLCKLCPISQTCNTLNLSEEGVQNCFVICDDVESQFEEEATEEIETLESEIEDAVEEATGERTGSTETKGTLLLAEVDAIEGEWIVVMNAPDISGESQKQENEFSVSAAEALIYEVGISSVEVVGAYSSALRGFGIRNMSKLDAKRLAKNTKVKYVEQSREVSVTAAWGIDRADQRSLPLNNCYRPFNQKDGSDVYAYIIDSGIRITHNEFKDSQGQHRARWGTNTVGDHQDEDCNGHGTHVAGTVGAKHYGIAPNINLVAVKVVKCNGKGSTLSLIQGIEFVMNDARGKKAVTNISISNLASTSSDQAVKNLVVSGVPTIVAAGNYDSNACNYSPARESYAITVGATASNDYRAWFSNWGPCVDIFAPGQSIQSTYYRHNNDIYTDSGTSMAASHVTGYAALLLEYGYSHFFVKSQIINRSTKYKVHNAGTASPNRMLYAGGNVSAACPSKGGGCVSGDTGIYSEDENGVESVKVVSELKVGDAVRGFDSNLNKTSCKVEAIGQFGTGDVYGNYTADHFIFNTKTDKIEPYGTLGDKKVASKYDFISDCPLVEDESGVMFGPIDSDFCGGEVDTISWKNYLELHVAILRVVLASGPFWFDSSSYNNMATVKQFAPSVCKNMLRCMKDNTKCNKLEKASQKFIDKALTEKARAKTLSTFSNLGSRCQIGSVSAVVTSGKSVDTSLIGTASC